MLKTPYGLGLSVVRGMTLLLIWTNFAQCSDLQTEIFTQYGKYLFAILVLLVLLLTVLFFKLSKYKKALNQSHKELEDKELEIEKFQSLSRETERRELEKDHEFEKSILQLDHKVRLLEERAKEGLKSQVLTKIEEYQNRRAKLLERAGIEQ